MRNIILISFSQSSRNLLILGLVLITILNVPYFFADGNIFMGYDWDFLDSNVVWIKLITENDLLFKPNNFPVSLYMNSQRVSFGSEFNIVTLLVYFFKPYLGFAINQFIIQLIAFTGIYKIISKYVFDGRYNIYNFIISITFCLLPFWLAGGIGAAGMPLMLYVFLGILLNTEKKYYWLVPIIYCFYSSLFVFGLFLMIFLFAIWIYKTIISKKINYKILYFLTLMTFCFVLVEWRIFYEVLIKKTFVAHRLEFYNIIDFNECLDVIKTSFLNGQDHVKSFHSKYILYLSISAAALSFVSKKSKIVLKIMSLLVIISILHGVLSLEVVYLFLKKIPILSGFQLDRLYTLYPLLWFLVYSLSIIQILVYFNKYKSVKYFLAILCLFQLKYVADQNIQIKGIKDLIKDKRENYTFNEFYATKTFDKIKKDINAPLNSYKVMSFGLQPAIAAFNNMQTIDGYNSFYDIEYKHQFRKIIAKELEQNLDRKKYFDQWGSRCYLFDNESVSFNNFEYNLKITNLELDYEVAKSSNVKYLISTYLIKNHKSLEIFKTYKDKLRIYYIYKLI